jgi:2-oxoisovalerate dehydrogenase E1 component
VLLVTWANGLYLSLRVAERLEVEGISCRVLDLRWLAPLPLDVVADHARAIGRVVVVDETRHAGGVGEAILAGLVERRVNARAARVAAQDCYVPLGDAANLVLVSEPQIESAVRSVLA